VIGTEVVENYLADHVGHKGTKAARSQYEAWLDGRISGISFRRQGAGYALPPLRVFQLLEFCAMLAL